ncbi:MAG: O-antigen ligase family protein [Candidatus Eremiobacteraeota bacterium]|nr:O-antigen ligase family protein [Candidatus Eremiobacteraeota bacterium]MBV8498160.1 O-antigen ligase family protein [Candidatus Eremiobacteraeota bacterium]
MVYRPVVDQFVTPVPLDPPSAALFVAAFVAAALVTSRRAAYGLAALILATPFAFAHEVAGTSITLPKVVLLGVLLGLSTYSRAATALRERPAPLLLGALGLYCIATALTIADAAHRGPVVRETLKAVEYAGVFVAAFCCYRVDPEDAPLLTATAVAAIVVAGTALAQEIAGAPSGLYIGAAIVPRIAGVLEGPNQLSAYCEIATASLGAWAVARPSAAVRTALFLIVWADVLSFSRAGLFGLAVVAAILAAVTGRAAWRALRPALYGLAAGALGSAWWAVYAHTPGVLRVSLQPSLYAGGVGNRSELWAAAWRMWREHPLLGVGAGNFELELPRYGVYGVRTHANSWYLQSLAEGGIVLLCATVALVAAILAALLGNGAMARLRNGSPWVVAAVAATVALALHQFVDLLVFYPKVGGAWWLLVGIAAAARSTRA